MKVSHPLSSARQFGGLDIFRHVYKLYITCKRSCTQFEIRAIVDSETFWGLQPLPLLRPSLEVFGNFADSHFFNISNVESSFICILLWYPCSRPNNLMSFPSNRERAPLGSLARIKLEDHGTTFDLRYKLVGLMYESIVGSPIIADRIHCTTVVTAGCNDTVAVSTSTWI